MWSALGPEALCDIIKQKQVSPKTWVNEAWLQYARPKNISASASKDKQNWNRRLFVAGMGVRS